MSCLSPRLLRGEATRLIHRSGLWIVARGDGSCSLGVAPDGGPDDTAANGRRLMIGEPSGHSFGPDQGLGLQLALGDQALQLVEADGTHGLLAEHIVPDGLGRERFVELRRTWSERPARSLARDRLGLGKEAAAILEARTQLLPSTDTFMEPRQSLKLTHCLKLLKIKRAGDDPANAQEVTSLVHSRSSVTSQGVTDVLAMTGQSQPIRATSTGSPSTIIPSLTRIGAFRWRAASCFMRRITSICSRIFCDSLFCFESPRLGGEVRRRGSSSELVDPDPSGEGVPKWTMTSLQGGAPNSAFARSPGVPGVQVLFLLCVFGLGDERFQLGINLNDCGNQLGTKCRAVVRECDR